MLEVTLLHIQPLLSVKFEEVVTNLSNYQKGVSCTLIEQMIWSALGDLPVF
jgi:hypothetical protein